MPQPALDPVVIAQLREDLAVEDFVQVLGLMEKDARDMLAALAAAAAAGDAERWERAAHRLAGGASGVGAVLLEQQARHAMAEGLAGAATRLPLLAEAVHEACGVLQGLRT